MHKARGFDDIGYALVIKRDGKIETGEDLKKRAAHVKGFNSVSVGIVMIGGVDEDGNAENNFTEKQWQAAKHAFEFLTLLYPDAQHIGHRDLSPDKNNDGIVRSDEFMKDCPCFSVSQWIDGDLRPVADLYAPWELDEEVDVPEAEIQVEEVLEDNYEEDEDSYVGLED
jgi:N-acetyl-anhydromuramyl-L-alanine amidase AmpD